MVLFSQTHNPSLTVRKTQIERHSTGYLASTPQDCQGHKEQRKSGRKILRRWILELNKDISGKVDKSPDTSGSGLIVMY